MQGWHRSDKDLAIKSRTGVGRILGRGRGAVEGNYVAHDRNSVSRY